MSDTPPIRFGTKAETLERLQAVLGGARILDQLRLEFSAWQQDRAILTEGLGKQGWLDTSLIARSSALNEDGSSSSQAGRYCSVAGVRGTDAVAEAIDTVFASFDGAEAGDQVFLQPLLEVKRAGVLFTADLDTFAPYDIINYDSSGETDSITGGSHSGETRVLFREAPREGQPDWVIALLAAARELEALTGKARLDIEFAFDPQEVLHLLQVRPITGREPSETVDQETLADALGKLHKKLEKRFTRHPDLLGDHPLYGLMPDWNPAEIIGVHPRPLALSLYQEVVTDNIWAYQRDNYGYRNLRSHPLLFAFLGVPYIDVRVSFNSFVPGSLPDALAEKLVNHYLHALEQAPEHHDKVEFEILHSCYYLNLEERMAPLRAQGFSADELEQIQDALRSLTNAVIHPEHGLYKRDLERIEQLNERYTRLCDARLPRVDFIYWLIEDAKRFGTLPFAGIARAGFIAVQFLDSLVALGILSEDDRQAFMHSLRTVSRALGEDLHTMDQEAFLDRYGHLRPGTYDLLSPRYDEAFERYFPAPPEPGPAVKPFTATPEQLQAIDTVLGEHGLEVSAPELLTFIREAIEGREYAKFVFTRSTSEALRQIAGLGERLGLDAEAMSFVDVQSILRLYSRLHADDVKTRLENRIDENRADYRITQSVKLPDLILQPDDIYAFQLKGEQPNFITHQDVLAETVREADFETSGVEGKIALIDSADPGYDYLFSKGIAGLITRYGGANSHMAIRCAELGLPAVIGAGERHFSAWSRASVLEIRCAIRQVTVIS